MRNKKIFIVSFNVLSIDFWKEYINFDNTELWHWKSAELVIDNLLTVWPDMVIVDGYFSTEYYKPCVDKISRLKECEKLYCITPKDHSNEDILTLDKKVVFSRLDSDVLEEINNNIQGDVFIPMNKTA